MVARTILETLRVVTEDPDDVNSVLNVMTRLADDVEPSVRAELMEQVPHIAMYGQEYKAKLAHVVPQHLLPMVVKFLTDTNNQVRKTSQAALLVLLEQGLVERSDVQEQVCPVIIRLTEADSLDDYRTEAVAVSEFYKYFCTALVLSIRTSIRLLIRWYECFGYCIQISMKKFRNCNFESRLDSRIS